MDVVCIYIIILKFPIKVDHYLSIDMLDILNGIYKSPGLRIYCYTFLGSAAHFSNSDTKIESRRSNRFNWVGPKDDKSISEVEIEMYLAHAQRRYVIYIFFNIVVYPISSLFIMLLTTI